MKPTAYLLLSLTGILPILVNSVSLQNLYSSPPSLDTGFPSDGSIRDMPSGATRQANTMTCFYDTSTVDLIHCSNGKSYLQSNGFISDPKNTTPSKVLKKRYVPIKTFSNGKAPDLGVPQTPYLGSRNSYAPGEAHVGYSSDGHPDHSYRSSDGEAGWSKYSGGYGYGSGYGSENGYGPTYCGQGSEGPNRGSGKPIYRKRSIALAAGSEGNMGISQSAPTVVHVPINIDTLQYPDGRVEVMPSSAVPDAPVGGVGSNVFV